MTTTGNMLGNMRTGELKSLLTVLRAAGVSEFTDEKRGVSVKLGAHVPVAVTASTKAKKAGGPSTRQEELETELLGSKKAQGELLKLGVDAASAAEVLADVS